MHHTTPQWCKNASEATGREDRSGRGASGWPQAVVPAREICGRRLRLSEGTVRNLHVGGDLPFWGAQPSRGARLARPRAAGLKVSGGRLRRGSRPRPPNSLPVDRDGPGPPSSPTTPAPWLASRLQLVDGGRGRRRSGTLSSRTTAREGASSATRRNGATCSASAAIERTRDAASLETGWWWTHGLPQNRETGVHGWNAPGRRERPSLPRGLRSTRRSSRVAQGRGVRGHPPTQASERASDGELVAGEPGRSTATKSTSKECDPTPGAALRRRRPPATSPIYGESDTTWSSGYRPDSCRNTLQGGPAGRVVELDAEQPPEQPRCPPEGTWSLAPRESSESPTWSLHDQGSLPVRLARCGWRSSGAQGQGGFAVRSEIKVAAARVPAARSAGLSMECGFLVFPDRYGTRNPSCSVLPTEPRRSPAAAGLPRPGGRLGSTQGLELSPWSVFPHGSGRYPILADLGSGRSR